MIQFCYIIEAKIDLRQAEKQRGGLDSQPEIHPESANEQEEMAHIYMVEQLVCAFVCVSGGGGGRGD